MRTISLIEANDDVRAPSWKKSSHSAHDGNCVEMASIPSRLIAVRDSKNPGESMLVFPALSWVSFIDALKRGATAD